MSQRAKPPLPASWARARSQLDGVEKGRKYTPTNTKSSQRLRLLPVPYGEDQEEEKVRKESEESIEAGLIPNSIIIMADGAYESATEMPASMEMASPLSPDGRQPKEFLVGLLEFIEGMAQDLQVHVDKYPSTGVGFTTRAQPRFLAIKPDSQANTAIEDDDLSSRKSLRLHSSSSRRTRKTENPIQQWCQGSLGWWENSAAFHTHEAPKGSISLCRIARVSAAKEGSNMVVIKHKQEDGSSTAELVICFASAKQATEWRCKLWTLLMKLRSAGNMGVV